MQQMDWDNIRFFLAVYRQHSLRAAARHLGVDQATAGRRLSALERQLGAKLFVRTPGGYLPTPAAELLFAGAERIEDEVQGMARSALGLDQRLTGQVRVATGEGLASVLVIPAMERVPRAASGYPHHAAHGSKLCGRRPRRSGHRGPNAPTNVARLDYPQTRFAIFTALCVRGVPRPPRPPSQRQGFQGS